MIVLSQGEPPPVGPWGGLALAAVCFGSAFALVRLILQAYDRRHGTSSRASERPRWWRIRVVGYREMTAVPLVFFAICAGISMIGYSMFVWTGLDGFGIGCVLFGLASVGCFFWGVYDSFGPPARRRNGRDEYALW